MPFEDIVLLSELDIGLGIRKNNQEKTSLINFTEEASAFKKKLLNQTISLDQNGEYSFSNISLGKKDHQVFYDGAIKVAEFYHENGKLIIKSYVDKQVNVFSDIVADECVIDAKGALCIDGKIDIETSLELSAKSVYLADDVKCAGMLDFKIQQGMGFSGAIDTKDLSIHSAFLQQQGHVKASEQYDISVQAFQQCAGVKTDVRLLRLLAEQVEISGDLIVADNCFLRAKYLSWGDKSSQSTIQLLGDNYIRAFNCVLKGDTQVSLNKKSNEQKNQIIFDNELLLDRQSVFDVKHSLFDVKNIFSDGEITFQYSIANIDSFSQNGLLVAEASNLTVYEKFYQSQYADTQLKKSNFASKESSLKGDFLLDDSEFIGENARLYAGSLSVKGSELHLQGSLLIDAAVDTVLNNSKVNVSKEIICRGMLNSCDVEINTKSFHAFDRYLNMESTDITAVSELVIKTDATIKAGTLISRDLRLQGELDIDDLELHSHVLKLSSNEANIKNCVTDTYWLVLEGGEEKDKVKFDRSNLTAKMITERRHVLFKDSTITGSGDVGGNHYVEGRLELMNSKFITDSQVYISSTGNVKVNGEGNLKAGRIVNNAKLTSKNSEISADVLLHSAGKFKTANSKVTIKEKMFLRGDKSELEESSKVTAGEIYSFGTLCLTDKSVLTSEGEIIATTDSKLESDASDIIAKTRFVDMGRTKLSDSLLSAQELTIYHQFTATDRTRVEVKGKVALSATADALLKGGLLTAKTIESSGHLQVENAEVEAQESLNTCQGSSTELVGASQMQAKNMILGGDLKSQSKFLIEVEEKETISNISGLSYKQVPGDGNCFYYAVAFYTHSGDQRGLRKLVSDYIKSNLEQFREHIVLSPSQTMDEYLQDIHEKNVWADNIQIEALMRVLDRPIIIITDEGIRNKDVLDRFKGDPIFVYYNGYNHYDGLLKQKDTPVQEVLNQLIKPSCTLFSHTIKRYQREQQIVPQVKIQEELYTSSQSKISGDNLTIEADKINHAGELDLSEALRAKGGILINAGTLNSQTAFLGFDQAVVNMGDLSATDLTVHSNFLNLGWASAKKNFSTSGFLNGNLGFISANNYSSDSLLSLNSGVVLPVFSTAGFSTSNLISFGKNLVTVVAPGYSNTVGLISMVPGLMSTGRNLYGMYQRYNLEAIKSLRMHEIMPLVCQVKSAALFGMNAFTTMRSTCSEVSNLATDLSALYNKATTCSTYTMDNAATSLFSLDWGKVGKHAGTLLSSNYTDNSLLHFNIGASFAGSTSKSNLFHCNAGVERSLFSHSIDTRYLFNSGESCGGQSNFVANTVNNSGSLHGRDQFRLKAKTVLNNQTGDIDGVNVSVDIDQLDQRGKIALQNGHARINQFKDDKSATTQLFEMHVSGNTFDSAGGLEAKKTTFDYSEHFHASADSEMAFSQGVSIKTKDFSQAGTLSYQDRVSIKADTAKFLAGSSINGKRTEEDKVFKYVEVEVDESVLKQNNDELIRAVTEIEHSKAELEDLLAEKYRARQKAQRVRDEKEEQYQAKKKDLDNIRARYGGKTSLIRVLFEYQNKLMQAQKEYDRAKKELDTAQKDFQDYQQEYEQADAIAVEKTKEFEQLIEVQKEKIDRPELEQDQDELIQITIQIEQSKNGLVELGDLLAEKQKIQQKAQAVYDSKESQCQAKKKNCDAVMADKEKSIQAQKEYHQAKQELDNAQNDLQICQQEYKKVNDVILQESQRCEQLIEMQNEKSEQIIAAQKLRKEFNPQHVLEVEAKQLTLAGKVTGGDFTRVKGKEAQKAESVVVEETADIDLARGSIDAVSKNISGRVKLEEFKVNGNHTKVSQQADLALSGGEWKDDSFHSDGRVLVHKQKLEAKHITFSDEATEVLEDSVIKAGETLVDESQIQYSGINSTTANHYVHRGRVTLVMPPESDGVTSQQNLFAVKTNTADLDGSGAMDNACYEIESFPDGEEFVVGSGKYADYQFSRGLSFKTKDHFVLNTPSLRDCDLSVTGSSFSIGVDCDTKHSLDFTGTKGDVVLTSNLHARSIKVQAKGDIYANKKLVADNSLLLHAVGGCYGLGSELSADVVSVEGAEVINVTKDSGLGRRQQPHKVGDKGIITARKVYVKATRGDIQNHGGKIQGSEHAQLIAKGDVLNLCNVRSYRGSYDVIKVFDPGVISGGYGSSETDGIGLIVKADGKVFTVASDYTSNGDLYIEGVKGVEFQARHHTYVSLDLTKKKGGINSKKTRFVKTATNIRECEVVSGSGRNIIRSGEGGVSAVGTSFVAEDGTDIYSKQKVQLFSLKTNNRSCVSTRSSFCGVSIGSSSRNQVIQSSTPTLILDNGSTRIHSLENDVDARGALFLGDGDLSVKAGGRIKLGRDILTHELHEKTRNFGFAAPGLPTFKLGADTINTTNSLMRGVARGTLAEEMLAYCGWGGAQGFSPRFSFSMTETSKDSTWQTTAPGGVNRDGKVILQADEGVDLENGAQLHGGKSLEINAPEVLANGAELKHASRQKSNTVSVGVTMNGVSDVGVSNSKASVSGTQYQQSILSTNGHITMHHHDKPMRLIALDVARIEGETVKLQTEKLVITDRQDQTQTKSSFSSMSTSGQFSVYKGAGETKVTSQKSGIHAKNELTGKVGEIRRCGGEITAGVNNMDVDTEIVTSMEDNREFNGIGFSGNIHEIDKVFDTQQPTNATGEKAIAMLKVKMDKVCNNKSLHLDVDIPLTNLQALNQAAENIQKGTEKLAENLGSTSTLAHQKSVFPVELETSEKYKDALDYVEDDDLFEDALSDFDEFEDDEDIFEECVSEEFFLEDDSSDQQHLQKDFELTEQEPKKNNPASLADNKSSFFSATSNFQLGPTVQEKTGDSKPTAKNPHVATFFAETEDGLARVEVGPSRVAASAGFLQETVSTDNSAVKAILLNAAATAEYQPNGVAAELSVDVAKVKITAKLPDKVCNGSTSYQTAFEAQAGVGAGIGFQMGMFNQSNGRSTFALSETLGVGLKETVKVTVDVTPNDSACGSEKGLHFSK